MNKAFTSILIILSIIGIAMILFYPFILWPWGDDIYYKFILSKQSIIQFTINEGLNFDARGLSPLALFSHFLYKFLPHSIAIVFYILCFLCSIYMLLFRIIKLNVHSTKDKFIFFIFFSIIMFHGLNIITSEVLFWQAGAYYSLNLVFGIFWIILFNKISFAYTNKIKLVFFYILSIIAGTFTYNLSFMLCCYVALFYLAYNFKNYKKTIWALLIIITIAMLLILSPASFNRVNTDNLTAFQKIGGIIRAFVHVPKKYCEYSYPLIFFIFVFSFTYHLYKPYNQDNDIKFNNHNDILKYFIFIIVAFTSIAPFLFAPALASIRTSVFFMFFASVFIFKFSQDIFSITFKYKHAQKNIAGVIILFVLIYHIFSFADHYYIAYDLRKQYLKRDEFLKQEALKHKTYVELEPYVFQFTPFTLEYLKRVEPTNNPNSYKNKQYQLVYGIDTIVIKK